MNARWKALAARIDGLSLRERAFLFLSLLAVCVALVDVLWITPARDRHRVATQKFAQQNIELQRLRDEVRARADRPDPARAAREEIARLQQDVAAVNRDIAELSASSKGGMALSEVLVHFLRRHAGLTLVRTSNLPGDALAASAAGGGATSAASPAIARNGLELTVSGPYPELVRYVQTLETAMPNLRWGGVRLAAEQQPPELNLQVFLIGPQP